MHVKDYMHTELVTVTPDDPMPVAYQRMRESGRRHLPVVTGQHTLVGVLSDRDVRQAGASDAPPMAEHELHYLLDKLCVRDVMTTKVVTVRGSTLLTDAGQLFLETKVGCLPVVRDDQTLEGIITVTDLLRAYVDQNDRGRTS
jgi:acetoin utilization protein AcuB